VVSLVMAYRNDLAKHLLLGYVIAQLIGAALGAWLAHAMFNLEILQWSAKVRTGPAQWLAEAVATAGLLFVILRSPQGKASSIVACYIGAAYWFAASTSFANPAAAFGRMFSNTFAGISPADVPAFVVAQVVGGFLGMCIYLLLKPEQSHSPDK
jgi:glycerol uptake facilitator-like aquaporin